ncbi:uncharacterized protein [Halyomorpha halys]|uniref:uncharacterized protein n=1 Tax=Halyomorpha halys TaxID=286706 RepID=UPI0034D2C7EC
MKLFIIFSQLVLIALGLPEGDPVSSALCRTKCIHQHLESPAIEDRDCAIQPDCFLCWEHCGILSKSNVSQEKLCADDHCSEGCQTACSFFKEIHPPSKEALVFPKTPTLNDGFLEWEAVPNAELYSISLVYMNRSMRNVGQTVSCKFRIPKSQLLRVTRIVVIAVNNDGALGIINYNILRRIVKKNVSTSILKLKEEEKTGTLNFPPIHNPVLWLNEHNTVRADDTLVKTKITWNFMTKEKYMGNHVYLLKWWIPELNMEGKSVVNNSQTTELTHLYKYMCLVKVQVMGTEMESQILVLKKDNLDLKTPQNNLVINSFLLGSVLSLFMVSVIIAKFISRWKLNEFKETKENSSNFYNI